MTKYIGTRIGGSSAKLASSDAVVSLSGIDGIEGERTLTAGTGITITDGGAGSTVTLSQATTTLGAPYVTVSNDATLTGERALTAGTGIALTDGGANSTITVSSTTADCTYVTLSNNANLSADRTLTAGTGIAITDGGANGLVTVSSTLVSGVSYICVSDESAKLAGMRQLTAGANITIGDSGAGGDIIISATGGGATVTNQTWGTARPAAPSSGDIIIWRDIPYKEICSGTGWLPLYDPYDLYGLQQQSKLSLSMPVIVGQWVDVKTFDDTILNGGSVSYIPNAIEGAGAGAGVSLILAYSFSAKSELLIVAGPWESSQANQGASALFMQNAALGGSDMDNGYMFQTIGNANSTINKEDAGFSALATANVQYRYNAATGLGMVSRAFYYKDSTGELTGFYRNANGTWWRSVTATDSTFTTMVRAGFRFGGALAAGEYFMQSAPVLIFGA